MILYFSGGNSSKDITEFMQKHNCSRLFSYVNDKKCIEAKMCDDVFMDCGAWSAYTKKIQIDIDSYIKYMQEHKDCYTVAASLDVLPDSRLQNYRESANKSYDNFVYMRKKLKNSVQFIPTYHRGEPIDNLLKLLNYEDSYGKITYIGIGAVASMKSRDVRDKFLENVFDLIAKVRPDIKIHLFGLTDLSLLEKYTVYSADSTTWLIAGAMGEILTDFGRIKISGRNMRLDSVNAYSDAETEALRKYVGKFGFTLEQLQESDSSRQMFNILYMKTKTDSIIMKQVRRKHSKLF